MTTMTTTTKGKSNGVVVWAGYSRLNGSPVVAIVTGIRRLSKNRKTGGMMQLWILPASSSPLDAVASGEDEAVCGSCPHRGRAGRTCYVDVAKAPSSVWRAWRAGRYLMGGAADLPANQPIRLGAYGDPAALPPGVLKDIVGGRRHTGYTHAWRRFAGDEALRGLLMASVDSAPEYWIARDAGWRTFRVGPARDGVADTDAELRPGEIVCPSPRVACEDCGLCAGASRPARSIYIEAHGLARRSVGLAILQ